MCDCPICAAGGSSAAHHTPLVGVGTSDKGVVLSEESLQRVVELVAAAVMREIDRRPLRPTMWGSQLSVDVQPVRGGADSITG